MRKSQYLGCWEGAGSGWGGGGGGEEKCVCVCGGGGARSHTRRIKLFLHFFLQVKKAPNGSTGRTRKCWVH